MTFLKALWYTIVLALTIVVMLSTLYVAMWVVFGIAIIGVFLATYNLLKSTNSLKS